MRVCVVSDQAFPAWGGEGVATQNLCKNLSKKGHRVLFLTSRVPNPPQVKDIEIVRFPSIFVPHKGYFAIAFWSQIVPILKRAKVEIVHSNLPTFLGWQSFIAAKKINIPCVAGFHVQVGNVIPYRFSILYPFKKIVEMWFSYYYTIPDVIISPSFLGKRILSFYSSRKVEVVSNGVDLDIFKNVKISFEERKKFREKFRLKDFPFLLYVGRLSREKNVAYLLKIMKILKKEKVKTRLLLVGRGELKKELEDRARCEGLLKEIIFAGFLPQRELILAYKEADIFILPSFFELQSIVALEAMATGNVILVGRSSQNAASEMVKEGINGYTFDLENPCDAANKIKLILSSPSLKESMQKASFYLAREHDIKKSISQIEKIYSYLL